MQFLNPIFYSILLTSIVISTIGCKHLTKSPRISAMPASPGNMCEPNGIPFYLPKPLLIVSKNFHHIEEAKVGLTDSVPIPSGFDAQGEYAKLNMAAAYTYSSNAGTDAKVVTESGEGGNTLASPPRVHSSGAPMSPGRYGIPTDGLAPHTFFTYEIVFVPDMTQKYVLQVEGGAGEFRAAMNLVNGWQFTGLGPYYMKDSSTAQNLMSAGILANLGLGGAADVINSVAELHPATAGKDINPEKLAQLAVALEKAKAQERFDFGKLDGTIEQYAEIFVYEPNLNDIGQMEWRQIVGDRNDLGEMIGHKFNRRYLGTVNSIPSSEQSSVEGEGKPNASKATKSSSDSVSTLIELMAPQNNQSSKSADTKSSIVRNDLFGDMQSQEDQQSIAREMFNRTIDTEKPTSKKKHLRFLRKKPAIENRFFSGAVSE